MEQSGWETARQAELEAKRELILRVATDHINAGGYTGASMSGIAGELGLTPNALYYYFESKEEILYSCFERAIALIDRCIDGALAANLPPIKTVRHFVVAFVGLLEETPLPFAGNAIFLPKKRLMKVDAGGERHVSRLAAVIGDAESGDIDAVLTARLLLSGLYSLDQENLRQKLGREALIGELDALVERILSPLGSAR